MSLDMLAASCALGAYAASTAFEIELPNGREVAPSATFGPALAALGSGGYHALPTTWLLLAALLIQAIIALLRKRTGLIVVQALGLVMSFSAVTLVGRSGLGSTSKPLVLVVTVGAASTACFALDVLYRAVVRSVTASRRFALIEAARAAAPLTIVMASGAGLIVLVYPRLGWASFVVMFVPVLAARYEFARYRQARLTYEETVRALARLAEEAGYVPAGHQARVSDLSVKVAQQLALSSERIHELELVGLLHDVGAVSLPDPSDVSEVDAELIARSSGLVLEETEYLADWAPLVLAAAQARADAPLEAKILRIADLYDRLEGSAASRLAHLTDRAMAGEEHVLAALGLVVGKI